MKPKYYYRVEIQYPYTGSLALDEDIEALVGSRSDSGCGFGYRDIGYCTDTKTESQEIVSKLSVLQGIKVWVRKVKQ